MNFVATYTDAEGCEYRIKTYTYVEALAIIKNCAARGYFPSSIEPLSDFAKNEMNVYNFLDVNIMPVFLKILNNNFNKGVEKND